MSKSRIIAAALAAIIVAAPAAAANITAQDPKTILSAIQAAGYKATLKKDDEGSPMIESESDGSTFVIFFMSCTNKADCRTIQFYAGFKDAKANFQTMNKWNADHRFARAYVTDKGSARIEYDLDLDAGGMSAPLFGENLDTWIHLMRSFENSLAEPDAAKKAK